MGCGSCSTGACSTTTSGCNNNGGCGSGGCNKVNTFDWLGNMQQPNQNEETNIYEVRFKNTRKSFFRNVNRLNLLTGDLIAVESDRGFDVGQISLGGILARLQMKKRKVDEKSDKVKKIFRLATDDDLEKLKRAREREKETLIRSRAIVASQKLEMKVSDVEFQGDNTKAIFYYIADARVDFRELIKVLAGEFKIRVEMKQIGLRHEAGLVGGIGSCGRELCCSTWLTEFKTVGTSAARYQNLSLNPMKISGQCGRLKCCLNYELDAYMDALKGIPEVTRLETEIGVAYLQKTDIFMRKMWFSYQGDSNWIPLTVPEVQEMMKLNKQGIKPATLQSIEMNERAEAEKNAIDFVDVVGQSKPREDPRRKKKKRKPGGGNPNNPQGPRNAEGQTPRTPPPPRTEGGENKPVNRGPNENRNQGPNPRNQGPNPRHNNPNQQRPPREKPPEGENKGPRPPRPEGQQGPEGERRKNPRHNRNNKNRGPRRDGPNNNNKEGGNNPTPPPPPPPQQ
jgi:cell fate regulator YaaT (PSP1 superfamily)